MYPLYPLSPLIRKKGHLMTLDDVATAKQSLEAAGTYPSYDAVLRHLGRGSKRDVSVLMRHLGGGTTPAPPANSPRPVQRLPRLHAQYGHAVRAVIDRLQAMPPGAFVAYQELSLLAGRQIQRARWILASARAYLLETHGMVFDPQVGEGLRCLGDAAKIDRGSRRRAFLHNYSVKSMHELQTVDVTTLTPVEHQAHYTELVIAGSTGALTYDKTAREITRVPVPTVLTIDLAQYANGVNGGRDASRPCPSARSERRM